jgi:hypothetical protein
VLAAALAAALVSAAFGENPIWRDDELTLSEAIAAGADADLVRLLGMGADVNATYDVRPGLLGERPARVTPLEAAVLVGSVDIADRLLARGATVDAATWNRLRCAAASEPLVELLEHHRPADGEPRCDENLQ